MGTRIDTDKLMGRALNLSSDAGDYAVRHPVNTLDYRMGEALRLEADELYHALDCGGLQPFPRELTAYASRVNRAEAMLSALRWES